MNVISWSGGKDSTATVILAHIYNIPINYIIISLPYFDISRKIYADRPDHLDWVFNVAIPKFEEWGYKVKVLSSDKDYMYWFYKVLKRSKYPEHNGKYYGFMINGRCWMHSEKFSPINKFIKKQMPCIEFVGIAIDEPIRLERLKDNQSSLLEKFNYTEYMATQLCEEYELLSPIYQSDVVRNGCWFCPNCRISEFADLKIKYPELWHELQKLSKVKNTATQGFKYGKTFDKVDFEVDMYIQNTVNQISLFKEGKQC